jgi:voltage-gated potassium channel
LQIPPPLKSETRYEQVRSRVHDLLENPPGDDRVAWCLQVFLALVIVLNTMAVVVYTVPAIEAGYALLLGTIITACLLVFSAEYFLRLWACTSAPTFSQRIKDRFRYAAKFFLIIDLLSIMPIFFPLFVAKDTALLRAFRLLSIFKLGRYARKSQSLALLRRVVLKKQEIFTLMVFFLVFVILFSSTIMYLVEHAAQPDKFSSIPAAMWWAAMTVTTVGYGDIYPITPVGQSIGSIVTFLGVLLLALPSAILASGFIEERHKQRETSPGALLENEVALLERVGHLKELGVITGEELDELRHRIREISTESANESLPETRKG